MVENDVDGFKEILRTHLELTNKDDFAKKSGIPKRTLFRMLTPEGNPTLDNVSKIIHQLCAKIKAPARRPVHKEMDARK